MIIIFMYLYSNIFILFYVTSRNLKHVLCGMEFLLFTLTATIACVDFVNIKIE